MKMNAKLLLSSVAIIALGLTGCGKNGLHGSSGSPIMNGKKMGANGTEVNGVSGASGFNGENFGGDTLAASASLSKTVYFGFDKYSLTDQAQAVMSQNAALLLKDPSMHVMVEGHTDPQGSESYNFHLGERRANAVQSYLLQHGVSASQVCTVSYGELRLAANPSGGDKEKAYALDRRAVVDYNQTCEGSGADEATMSAPAPAPKVKHHMKKKPKPVTQSASTAAPAPVPAVATTTTTASS